MKLKTSRYKQKSEKCFDRQAGDYDRSRDGAHSRKAYPVILEKLKSIQFQSIMDVGCGTGELLKQLLAARDARASGLDLSSEMIQVARAKLGDKVDLRVGDSEALPWDDGSFDILTCIDSFHHYPNPVAVLKEMRRVLKPTGQLLISDVWLQTPMRQVGNAFIRFSRDGDYKIYSRKAFEEVLRKAGFAMQEWEVRNSTNSFMNNSFLTAVPS